MTGTFECPFFVSVMFIADGSFAPLGYDGYSIDLATGANFLCV